jgi:hypothetical protein
MLLNDLRFSLRDAYRGALGFKGALDEDTRQTLRSCQ